MKLITSSILIIGSLMTTDNHSSFNEKYNQANQFCLSIIPDVQIISEGYDLNALEIIPIVFPECTRFNIFTDKIETAALRYLYVENGKESANFSIGAFQMKPAFIEALEKNIHLSTTLNTYQKDHFKYISNDLKINRSERFLRLNSLEWQIHYLSVFHKIMDEKFQQKKWVHPEDKIAFYASAYNFGFTASETKILNYQKKKAFPYGDGDSKESYGKIAKNYFLKLNHYAY